MLIKYGVLRLCNGTVTLRRWMQHTFAIAPASAYVAKWLESFKEFPPRQKPGSFNLDNFMEKLTAGSPGSQ
jgi:hypothetical protein